MLSPRLYQGYEELKKAESSRVPRVTGAEMAGTGRNGSLTSFVEPQRSSEYQ